MSRATELYAIQRRDLPKTGAVLADAFRADPLWLKLLEGVSRKKSDRIVSALYESSIRYCLRYGECYAISEDLEGIIAWVPGDVATMTVGRQLRSGAFSKGMKAMALLGGRSRLAARALAPVPPARQTNMKGRPFIYLQVLGIATDLQGRGLGGRLLGALVDHSDQTGIPLYTETTLGEAVGFYERRGFTVINQISLPAVDVPLWEFLREPSAAA